MLLSLRGSLSLHRLIYSFSGSVCVCVCARARARVRLRVRVRVRVRVRLRGLVRAKICDASYRQKD
jgi:hypothetical protein